jgi:hypothetical protein
MIYKRENMNLHCENCIKFENNDCFMRTITMNNYCEEYESLAFDMNIGIGTTAYWSEMCDNKYTENSLDYGETNLWDLYLITG